MENKETRQKKDGEDMKKGRYADGQSKPVDANSENIIEEKDIIKEEKILTSLEKKSGKQSDGLILIKSILKSVYMHCLLYSGER